MVFTADELDGRPPDPGPPVEAAHSADKRRLRQECPECGKKVGNLPSHRAQVHGVRGANEGKADRAPKAAAKGAAGAGELRALREQLEATYVLFGQVWAIKDPICGGALVQSAPGIAASWELAARNSDAVRRLLHSLMSNGALAQVAAAHLPLFAVIFSHHGPAARAQREAAQAAYEAEMMAQAAGEGWVPPGSVPADEAYGPYAPGSADNART